MLARDFDAQGPEQLRLFEAQLSQRLARLRQRGERLRTQSWDINTLALLAADAALLGAVCRKLDAPELADALAALHATVEPLLASPRLPDPATATRVAELIEALAQKRLPRATDSAAMAKAAVAVVGPSHENGFPLLVVPPPEYWTRFGDAIAPHALAAVDTADKIAAPPTPLANDDATIAIEPKAPAPLDKPAPLALHVYHLNAGGELASAVDLRLAAHGYVVTRFDDGAELAASLAAVAPALVLVDVSFADAVDAIGADLKRIRKEADHPIWLVALSAPVDVAARLHAIRVGCDALIELPASSDDIVGRIVELTEAARSDPYRVMVIEDDRAQTVFAESILRKAGMLTLAVGDALDALDELERFRPDLILMDLYMPGCDGIDLTTLIRQREAFVATPIVFLSGEHNADKHFEALDAGGDDFLAKPVRPKHLISAVTNRIRRTRQQRRRGDGAAPVAAPRPSPGDLLRRVSACLALDDAHTRAGGLLVFAMENAAQWRTRLGAVGFAALMDETGAFLVAHAGAHDIVAADADGRFLVFNPDCDTNLLEAYALNLRDRIAREPFAAAESNSPVVFDAGVCPFVAGAARAERMRDAAQDAIDKARAAGRRGVFMVREVQAEIDTGLIERIRYALDGQGFQLVFQPIVSLRGDEDEQFQALLRLRGDDGRVLTAAELVPAAEHAGLIGAVDRWVLHQCVALIAGRARGGQALRLFVSQSLASVRDAESITWLRELLAQTKIPGQAISLELRAAEAARFASDLDRWAVAVKALEASVTLSGFESGADTASLLQMSSIDYIKVAPRYLRFDDEATRNELRALVELAHDNGKRVIAPRVEDARGAAALWSAGVDFIQGNFVQQAGQDLAFDFHAAAT